VAESESLTGEAVLRRVQGAMSYNYRTGLDVSKEANGTETRLGWYKEGFKGT
jgi:hypothetical protein